MFALVVFRFRQAATVRYGEDILPRIRGVFWTRRFPDSLNRGKTDAAMFKFTYLLPAWIMSVGVFILPRCSENLSDPNTAAIPCQNESGEIPAICLAICFFSCRLLCLAIMIR